MSEHFEISFFKWINFLCLAYLGGGGGIAPFGFAANRSAGAVVLLESSVLNPKTPPPPPLGFVHSQLFEKQWILDFQIQFIGDDDLMDEFQLEQHKLGVHISNTTTPCFVVRMSQMKLSSGRNLPIKNKSLIFLLL